MYSLDQLRGFVAVAEELHFGRAAARLNMTQPPLSRQIQKLEKSIGVQLFERDNRGVALTAAGSVFLADAVKLLELAEAAPSLARRISSGSAGSVRIGFTAASTFGLLGALLNEISGALPDVEIDLREMVTRDQTASLITGEIDLGLARPPFDEDLFDSRLLYKEPIVVAVPLGHRLTLLDRPVTAEDLQGEDLIMHSPTQARYFYDLVISLVSSHRTFVHTVSQILTMIFLVAAGRGVALVPQSATVLGIEGVEYIELSGLETDPVELHAIWRRDARNPALHRVLDLITGSAE
ncbi:DNA-binding transcriptional LysR family regulator [Arthrobacter sp. V4I6]|uniref:LysR family transcriptional regulator n=1 Tax=unclassified Arthrobacter TaxID=235627 RepID=UPI0027897ADC|nr:MULTISPECIES: LysR family transcriptional regulator [unclassified Arthrobacter]MDQ0821239.1 DNA-binding transcriptional LysR family regulator [Arthrobacter sp. V1I7]MDQ0855502.1 DNA-binding transcriptional LysR family regulator [Arthrobacter sp. V4I6]